MILLTFIVLFTIAVSALCAALETMVLNATPLEVENLKKKSKQRGKVLEGLARNINRTISAISAIKIIVNIFGACLAGIQVSSLCPQESQIKYLFPPILAVLILFFAEILPKNIGILYLPSLQKHLAYPLCMLDSLMAPITKIPEWFAKKNAPA